MTNFMVSGNVSRAAETRTVTNKDGAKTLVTTFNVAVNDNVGSNGDDIVTFYKVPIWGQRGANLAPYLTVGKEVNISGIPGQEAPWVGQDGQMRAGALTIRRAIVELKGKKATAAPAAEGEDYTGEPVEG